MLSMLEYCSEFNQPLNNWDVSSVTNMESMFEECSEFNHPLEKWDVSSVRIIWYLCLEGALNSISHFATGMLAVLKTYNLFLMDAINLNSL